jgi:hypothetical protein
LLRVLPTLLSASVELQKSLARRREEEEERRRKRAGMFNEEEMRMKSRRDGCSAAPSSSFPPLTLIVALRRPAQPGRGPDALFGDVEKRKGTTACDSTGLAC